ncbi:MAG: hypothetical protein M5U25_16265 [Planctomycetota bacterium]|nr:hypothetical protein [Planctomycetota bacterium]
MADISDGAFARVEAALRAEPELAFVARVHALGLFSRHYIDERRPGLALHLVLCRAGCLGFEDGLKLLDEIVIQVVLKV